MKRSRKVESKNTSSKPSKGHSNVELAKASLLVLNDICLLQIFQFVKLDDFINLSETCSRLNRVAKSTDDLLTALEIERDVKSLDSNYYFVGNKSNRISYIALSRMFTQIGRRVKSLVFKFGAEYNVLRIIIQNCPQLKSLTLNKGVAKSGTLLEYFDNVETLKLNECCVTRGFFRSFRKLNFLRIADCRDTAWTTVFKNNLEMESCVFKGKFFPDFRLLQFLPKLNKLYLSFDGNLKSVEFEPLNMAVNLTALKLHCSSSEDVNNFIDIMGSFEKIEILVLVGYIDLYSNCRPTIWPRNLKHLTLEMVQISYNVFISTIRQLANLENIDVFRCETYVQVNDLEYLYRHVFNAMQKRIDQPKLNVFVPMDPMNPMTLSSKKHCVDSPYLKISGSRGEFINFPGWNE